MPCCAHQSIRKWTLITLGVLLGFGDRYCNGLLPTATTIKSVALSHLGLNKVD